MQRIAIMQGRLLPPEDGRLQSFPRNRWREEFPLAAAAGLNAIEWIYDLHGSDVNPLGSDRGAEEMLALAYRYKIDVVSVCADYFMDRPLITATPSEFTQLTNHLVWLLN